MKADAPSCLQAHDYRDCVQRRLPAESVAGIAANTMLADLLQGCVQAHPWRVRLAMSARNILVRPWRLRTSRIGCPVSSLLDREASVLFGGVHPVRGIVRDDAMCAEVVLGADDRHLRFRTTMRVARERDGAMQVSMATVVQTLNRFGWLYIQLVDPVHRRFIAPAILDAAIAHAMRVQADASTMHVAPACAHGIVGTTT